jgi:hypothetical protein
LDNIFIYPQFWNFTGFLDAFAKLRKATISFDISVSPSVSASAWNSSAPTEMTFMKFDIWGFLENSSFIKI